MQDGDGRMKKGIFIEGITVEMLKNASLEAVEELISCGDIIDAEFPFEKWIPVNERLPEKNGFYLTSTINGLEILEFNHGNPHYCEKPSFVSEVFGRGNGIVYAWMPLPEPYKEPI